jgi:hypothetical protein
MSAAAHSWDVEIKLVGPDDVEYSVKSTISAELPKPAIAHTVDYLLANSSVVVMHKMGLTK